MSQSGTPRNNASTGQQQQQQQQQLHRSGHNTPKDSMKLKSTVTDSTAANSRQLLNAYVYDFLIKSSLPNTAKAFYQEADVPVSNNNNTQAPANTLDIDLPPLSISMDAPQGFLYEWWQIFWDVFNARTHRVGSAAAQQYFQLHLLRQRQEHALHGMTAQAAQAQLQLQLQLIQATAAQLQQLQQPHGIAGSPTNNMSPQIMGKRPGGNMNSVARLQQEHAQRQMNNLRQQQLVQQQQQQQQQQQATPLNGQLPISIQSPSKRMRLGEQQPPDNHSQHSNGNTPTHVHNIPPNAAALSPHNLQNQIPPQGMMIPNQFNPQLAAAMFAQQHKQMNPQQQQQMAAAAAAAAAASGAPNFPQPQQLGPNKQLMMFNQQQRIPGEFFNDGFGANMMMQNQPPPPPQQQQQQQQGPPHKNPQMPQQNPQQLFRQPHQGPQQQPQPQQSPAASGPQPVLLLQNGSAGTNNSDNSLQARNSLLGLQDYQMQLILIERNNKKKMEDVRNIDIKNEPSSNSQLLISSEFNNMFNSQLQQQIQQQAKWNGSNNDNSTTSMPSPQLSRGTPVSSPAVGTQPGLNKNSSTTSTPASTTTKKKAAPKSRKKKTNANNNSEPATPTTPATPAAAASAPTPHSTTAANGSKRGTKRKESIKETPTSSTAETTVKKEAQTPASAPVPPTASNNATTSTAAALDNLDTSPHNTTNASNNNNNNNNDVDANMLNDYQQFNADTFGTSADSNFLSDFNTGNGGEDMALDLNVFLDTDGEVNNGSFMFNWGNVTES